MATEEPVKVTAVNDLPPVSEPVPEPVKPVAQVKEENSDDLVPVEKVDDTKALALPPQKIPDPPAKVSLDRDIALAGLETDKRLSYIKAWEENEKSKADNKASKKLSTVAAWENSKKADIESKLKKIEEELERKKADYGEKMKNKIAMVHKQAEEKRAMVEAKRGEDLLKADECSAKYRATNTTPKKTLGCFGS